jgi:Icc-related predicted phosphoesterase
MKAVLRVQPKVHIFGHIHEAYGEHQTKQTHFVNACNCDIYYRCVQKPIVVDLEIP